MPEEDAEEPAVVVGISVRKPDTTLYELNQELEEGQGYWDGLVVYWDYSDGSHAPVAKQDYRLTPDTVDTSDSGSLDIKVETGGYTLYFDMYVSSSTSVLQSISVVAAPPGPFYLAEPFKTAGMVVLGTYNDKTENVPLSAVSADGYSSFKRGEQQVTLRVNGKTAPLTVKTVVKPGSKFWANEYGAMMTGQHQEKEMKPAYIKGKEFDFAGSNIQAQFHAEWGSDFNLTLKAGNGLYPEDITGYNKDAAGQQTLTLSLDGVNAVRTFPVYVLDVQPDVWFDYGFMRHAGDPKGAGAGFGRYHVEQGKTLVLAPVRYLIGYNEDHTAAAGTSYDWYVDGVLQNAHTETFAFTPAAAQTYTVKASVTGRNYVGGMSVTKTVETAVVSFAPGTVRESKSWGNKAETDVLWLPGNR